MSRMQHVCNYYKYVFILILPTYMDVFKHCILGIFPSSVKKYHRHIIRPLKFLSSVPPTRHTTSVFEQMNTSTNTYSENQETHNIDVAY